MSEEIWIIHPQVDGELPARVEGPGIDVSTVVMTYREALRQLAEDPDAIERLAKFSYYDEKEPAVIGAQPWVPLSETPLQPVDWRHGWMDFARLLLLAALSSEETG